jgi:hypothetical protein
MPNQKETAMMASTILRASLACLVLMAVLLSAGCTGEEQSPTVQVPDTEFRGETFGYDDRVIFRFIPETDEAGNYNVTYTLEKGVSWGTTLESRENVTCGNVSRDNPIEFVVFRESPSNSAAIDIEIRSMDGEVLYRSRTAVAPATSTPALP